ncbi:TPA: hypothetical protein N0F65_003762 [Lagenidium giganteum]|uniref:Uncharacterized protein n=1 Tax=Lagenidium giganteum TaxID=4803 RepID=A0AAV2YEI0_9STRA|nr:TPA: hypothetical protein N0F65_003762 [Lagenidium giganteum]
MVEDDRKMVGHLNDISETCTTLTFVVQITMVGRYITRRVRIWSLRFMTFLAELLIAFGIFIVVLNVVDVATEHTLNLKAFDWMDNLMEDVSLGFIFVFRFYYIAMLRGFRHILETKKKELLLYLLFLTHEYPFMLLKDQTKLEWDDIQALWNRLTAS